MSVSQGLGRGGAGKPAPECIILVIFDSARVLEGARGRGRGRGREMKTERQMSTSRYVREAARSNYRSTRITHSQKNNSHM